MQGPLRSNTAGTAGGLTINGTKITSGSYLDSSFTLKTVNGSNSDLTGGPVGSFNQQGNGAVGSNNGNCGGDNCRIGGSNGAASYNGNHAGGAGGSASGAGTAGAHGTRGAGGGGGAAQVNAGSTNGGNGGQGELKYRFLNVF